MKLNWCCGLHKVTASPRGKLESRDISQRPDQLIWPYYRLALRNLSICICRHLGQRNTFIHCHCAQTTLLPWNISQRVCYKLQNLHPADTFISLSIRSICFCLYLHFSVLSRSVKWIFTLRFFVLLALTSFHLLIWSFMCFSLQVFLFYSPRCSLLDLWLFVCLCCLSQGFCLSPSVSFALSNPHISLCSEFLHRR